LEWFCPSGSRFWIRRNVNKKLKARDKEYLAAEVKGPFAELAQKITAQAEGRLARRVFKDTWVPEFDRFARDYPDIYSMLSKGKYLVAGRKCYELDQEYPITANLVVQQSWNTSNRPKIDSEAMKAVAGPELKEKFAKAAELEAKGKEVQKLVEEFLAPFESAAQIPFSFPQLLPFIEQKWDRFRPQKRPRKHNVPSARLRELVTASWLLRNAEKEKNRG
jgi:hypothetical protein